MPEIHRIKLSIRAAYVSEGEFCAAERIGRAVGLLQREGWTLESDWFERPRWYKPWRWHRRQFAAVLTLPKTDG